MTDIESHIVAMSLEPSRPIRAAAVVGGVIHRRKGYRNVYRNLTLATSPFADEDVETDIYVSDVEACDHCFGFVLLDRKMKELAIFEYASSDEAAKARGAMLSVLRGARAVRWLLKGPA